MTRGALPVMGWREWIAIPELGIDRIKVKVDTGARTSALHAYQMERFRRGGKSMIRFKVYPKQRSNKTVIATEAAVIDTRGVRSSTGIQTIRPVIQTIVRLGDVSWPIEVTLVRRDVMGFRMLLGRQAIRDHFLVNPGRSFLWGR